MFVVTPNHDLFLSNGKLGDSFGEMASRLEHTLRLFEREATDTVRVLAIGLHPHLIGVPHRFHELERMVDFLVASPDVTFVTGATIADWYTRHEPAPLHGLTQS